MPEFYTVENGTIVSPRLPREEADRLAAHCKGMHRLAVVTVEPCGDCDAWSSNPADWAI